MAKYTPETGYPRIDIGDGEQFDEEAMFTFDNGETVTGAHLNAVLARYLDEHPRNIG